MKPDNIQDFVLRYLQATRCQIIEKQPHQVTVKLSPEADRDLTNRPYYWSFVERTGAEPETMSFTFIFQPDTDHDPVPSSDSAKSEEKTAQAANSDTILGRFLGIVPGMPQTGRILQETVAFGGRRLQQIFNAVRQKGRFVHLFEVLPEGGGSSLHPATYSTWLNVNYKLELACDMKRDELHSLGICLSTGEICAGFFDRVVHKQLTPKMPAYTQLKETISFQTALAHLEKYMENKLKTYDYKWAIEAKSRMEDELSRIASYYENLAQAAEPEQAEQIRQQHLNRQAEIRWQYQPRVKARAVSCGLFHLPDETFSRL